MIDRVEILISRLRRMVSRNRWSARLMGHGSDTEHADAPGLILIQVDGLGEEVLRQALADGRMPFLNRLITRDGYQIHPLYAGLPSNTPGFQAELFYGIRSAVPAFCFLDEATGRVLAMSDPSAAALIEGRLGEQARGLLRGGSAWSNVFTGGAAESHLCASTTGMGEALRVFNPSRFLGILVWHGWSVVRVLANLVAITAVAFWDLFRGRLPGRALLRELRHVPARVAVSAVMREIVTTGASIDAERGLPVIHVNYLGYDEHAHRRGPRSRFARWSLKGIDRSIRRIWLAGHRSRRRDYQVWVYSDHGQEDSTPYATRFGEGIPEAVRRVYRQVLDGTVPSPTPASRTSHALAPPHSEARFRWLGRGLPPWLTGWSLPTLTPAPPVEDKSEVLVLNQGPMGGIYVPAARDRAFRERFATALTAAGIPTLILPDGPGHAIAFTRKGHYRLPEEGAALLGEDHPHLTATASDLADLPHVPGAGDLIMVGWNLDDPLTLQMERGSHGGPGPHETAAFAVLPPEVGTFTGTPGQLRPHKLRTMATRTLDRRASGEFAVVVPSRRYTPPTPVVGPDGARSVSLRIMTYNVHGCRGLDGSFAPGRIARVIARERPDVVCLQELDQMRGRSGGIDQALFLAERLQTDYQFHAVSEFDDGTFGNAVLSMLPMQLIAAGPLPQTPRMRSAFNLWDRGALWVAITVVGEEIQVINTHLSIMQQERRLQARALLGPEWLGNPNCATPVLLAGDLNAAPHSWTVRQIETRLQSVVSPDMESRNLRTWSGRVPLRRIDHLLVSKEFEVTEVRVPRTRLSRVASDHLPLVADVVCHFPPPPPDDSPSGS